MPCKENLKYSSKFMIMDDVCKVSKICLEIEVYLKGTLYFAVVELLMYSVFKDLGEGQINMISRLAEIIQNHH